MDKKVAYLIFILAIFLSPALADEWWDYDWSYRVPIFISSQEGEVVNAYVKVNIDFSQLLRELKVTGAVAPASIRVLDGGSEQPLDVEAEDSGHSVSWIAKGTLTKAPTQYYIYFDTVENGAKPEGRRITRNVGWVSGYEPGLSVESPEWKESWAKLAKVSWRWCTDTFNDKAYLFYGTGKFHFVRGRQSNLTTLETSKVKVKFSTPTARASYCLENKTKYGVAVDIIQFFPVTEFDTETPTFSSLGEPEFFIPAPSSPTTSTTLSIINYTPEVGVEMGWTKDYEVTVKNTGQEKIENVYAAFSGIPSTWFKVTNPPTVLQPGQEKKFTIQISPPMISRSQTYSTKLEAFSREAVDRKEVSIKVFTLQSELLRYEIEKVRLRLTQLENEAVRQDEGGLNVSAVTLQTGNAKTSIEQAVLLLDSQRYSQVPDYTLKAEAFLEQAELQLLLVEPKQRSLFENAFISLAVLAALAFVATFLIFFKRTTHAYRSVRAFERSISVSELKKEIQGKETGVEDLKEERERTQRFIMGIGNQHRQGLLSDETYQELKANAKNKLKALEGLIGGR